MPHVPRQPADGDATRKKGDKPKGMLSLSTPTLSLHEHTVDPLEVYEAMFGREPPDDASTAGIVHTQARPK